MLNSHCCKAKKVKPRNTKLGERLGENWAHAMRQTLGMDNYFRFLSRSLVPRYPPHCYSVLSAVLFRPQLQIKTKTVIFVRF